MSTAHIVMVEDNPPDVLVFQESLKRRGIAFTLEHYADGETAANRIAAMTAPPDLFVLDLNVPRIHGLELLSVIRAHPLTARSLVAILTSSQAAADKAHAERAGANLYLIKPDGFREFVERVGTAVEELLSRREPGEGTKAEASCECSGCPAKPERRGVRTSIVAGQERARQRAAGKSR